MKPPLPTFVKTQPKETPKKVLKDINDNMSAEPHFGVLPQEDADSQTRRQNKRVPPPASSVHVTVNLNLSDIMKAAGKEVRTHASKNTEE